MKLILFVIATLSIISVASGGRFGPEKSQESGYITVSPDEQSHIFYWMFGDRSESDTSPVVLWLTGGPGCSSELAIFYEQGPYRFDSDHGNKIINNQYAWNSNSTVVFVDQPVGTGWSYTNNEDDYVVNETEVSNDMYQFLQGFFNIHPELAKRDFYITGESYAGHYVPAISYGVHIGNQNLGNNRFIPLKGFAIGNGLVDSAAQYKEYGPYAYSRGLINRDQYADINETVADCEYYIKTGQKLLATITCNSIIGTIQQEGGNFNVYDVTKKCTYPPLCYDFSALDDLMARGDVQRQLGVSNQASWTSCNGEVHADLQNDWFLNLQPIVGKMLDTGLYKVLVYSGENDFICNWFGGKRWVKEMQWSGQQGYNSQNFHDWTALGQKQGTTKTQGNLIFLGIEGAGHMVPKDRPQVSNIMLFNWINGAAF